MERINLHLFYRLGSQLNAVTHFDVNLSKRFEYIWTCYQLNLTLSELMASFPTLAVCRQPALKLYKSIQELIDWWNNSEEERIVENDEVTKRFTDIEGLAKTLETILTAEVPALTTYHATQKGIYLTTDLIDRAENIFPPSVLSKINQAVVNEVRSSGRCLAFDNGTASAFHMMRAVETVMHLYYIHVCKPKPKPKKRLANWVKYITQFQNSTNPKAKEVVALIQQLKDRHRNLIMHPDIVLSPDEAFTLFEISQGVIIVMASELPRVKK